MSEDDKIYKVLRGQEEPPARQTEDEKKIGEMIERIAKEWQNNRVPSIMVDFAQDVYARLTALERRYIQSMAKQSATNKHLVEEIEELKQRIAEHAGGLKHT